MPSTSGDPVSAAAFAARAADRAKPTVAIATVRTAVAAMTPSLPKEFPDPNFFMNIPPVYCRLDRRACVRIAGFYTERAYLIETRFWPSAFHITADQLVNSRFKG